MSKEKICKNCNYKLEKNYCSNCGQKDVDILKFWEILKEFFEDILDLDSRTYRTLKYLLFRPGFLTTEYWEGRRMKYLPPFRLILITSFIYFIMVPLLIDSTDLPFYTDDDPNINQEKIELMDTWNNRFIAIEPAVEKYILLACTPFIALILTWLYRKKGLLYFHHLIAFLHLCSFDYCINTVFSALGLLLKDYDDIIDTITLVPLVAYFIIMMENLYNESYFKTILKSLVVISCLLFFILFTILEYVFIPPLLSKILTINS